MKPTIKTKEITMIKWKEYLKNIHNNNIKNEEIGNKRRKQIITKSKKMIKKDIEWQ